LLEKKAESKDERDPFEIANKHERLYCCRRKGVNYLIINSTQFFYVVTVIYFSYKVSWLLSDTGIGIAFGALGILLSIYIWFWVMPVIIDDYALTTSIEMMKNRECINQVLMHQKFERAKRSQRIYQVFKLIRREMIVEFRK
jgi:hypothetical protein